MANIVSILNEYKNKISNNLLAGETGEQLQKDDFVEKIRIVSRQNRVFLWINVAMLLVLFCGSIILIVYFVSKGQMTSVTIVSSISGLSIAGMIYYMTNLWRQVVGIELAIVMADKLGDAGLPTIINSLLATFKKPD
jgi:hypothetical protein